MFIQVSFLGIEKLWNPNIEVNLQGERCFLR